MKKGILFGLVCLCVSTTIQATTKYTLPQNTEVSHIVIKFKEGTGIKMRNGVLLSQPRNLLPRNIQISELVSNLSTIKSLVNKNKFSLIRTFDSMSDVKLNEMKTIGEARTKRKLPDLTLYQTIKIPKSSKFSSVEKLLVRLNKLSIVEFAYAQPLPTISNHLATPNFQANQGYLSSAPNGIDANYAWTVTGGKGEGVNVIDVEGAWNTTHEDFPALLSNSGNHYNDLGWRNHGTAVVGVIAAPDNGLGITGIANQVRIGVQSIKDRSTSNAILQAANNVGVGGIVLIELHNLGPNDGTACTCNLKQCNYVAMEYWSANFAAIQTATANGVIVVEAAGNGSANLDAAAYNKAFDRNHRDSGAILVAASRSTQRTPSCFTNYGTRIDVNGWGENVATLGYGYGFTGGHNEENRFYTFGFGGTSSASPIVVGAAASLQGIANVRNLPPFDSKVMRNLLSDTGTKQTAQFDINIGQLPNLKAAINKIDSLSNNRFETWSNTFPTGELNGLYRHHYADVNGDGRTDLIQIGITGGNRGKGWVGLADVNGNFGIWTHSFPTGEVDGSYRHYFADVNGDGRADLIQIGITGGNRGKGWVGLADVNGNFGIWTHSFPTGEVDGNYRHYFADVNGDGRTDLIQIGIKGGNKGKGWVGLADVNGNFGIWTHTFPTGEWEGTYRHYLADVNGDGRTDLVQLGIKGGNQGTGWVGLADVNGNFQIWSHSFPTGEWSGLYQHYLADVNGDNRADLIQFGKTGTNKGKGWVGLAGVNGNFQIWTSEIRTGEMDGKYNHYMFDVNSDGRQDLIQLDTQNGLGWIGLSDANGKIDIWAPSFTVDVTGGSYSHAFADTNGDGRTDIIQIEKNGVSGQVGLNK